MSMPAGLTMHKVLNIDDEVAISVVAASATSYTLDAANAWVTFQNVGSTNVWLGGSTVDPDNNRGYKIAAGDAFAFCNILEAFTVYFRCETGDSGTISVIKG